MEAEEAGVQGQARAEAEVEGEGECCILAGTGRQRSAAAACSASVVLLFSHLFCHIEACDAADVSPCICALLDFQGDLQPAGLVAHY